MSSDNKQQRQARFWRKFMRLTRGRINVMRALEVIHEEEADEALKAVILSVQEAMGKGAQLSEAVGKHPEEFSLSVRELVRAAEKTGAWDEIMAEIADGLADGTFD